MKNPFNIPKKYKGFTFFYVVEIFFRWTCFTTFFVNIKLIKILFQLLLNFFSLLQCSIINKIGSTPVFIFAMIFISHENIDKTDMVTIRIGEFLSKTIRIFLSVIRSHEDILDAEHRRENEHFIHYFFGGNEHDSQLRIEWDFGYIGSDLSQFAFIIQTT